MALDVAGEYARGVGGVDASGAAAWGVGGRTLRLVVRRRLDPDSWGVGTDTAARYGKEREGCKHVGGIRITARTNWGCGRWGCSLWQGSTALASHEGNEVRVGRQHMCMTERRLTLDGRGV